MLQSLTKRQMAFGLLFTAHMSVTSNLSPGELNNATRTQSTGGVVSGIDTYVSPAGGGYGAPLIQLGVLGGYQSTRSTFTTPPAAAALDVVNGAQIDEGGFVGVYGSYILNQFAADLLVKVDLFDHTTEPSVTCNSLQNDECPFLGNYLRDKYERCQQRLLSLLCRRPRLDRANGWLPL